MRLAVSSAGAVLINELINADPHGLATDITQHGAVDRDHIQDGDRTDANGRVGVCRHTAVEPRVQQSDGRARAIRQPVGTGSEPSGDVDNDVR